MVAKKDIKIGEYSFNTQVKAKVFMRSKMNELGSGTIIDDNHQDWEFFQDLIKGHHQWIEKIGVGVVKFEIRKNKKYPKNLEIWIVRIDRSEEDISWYKCIEETPTSPIKNLSSAMREAINSQIKDFRDANYIKNMPCFLCTRTIEDEGSLNIDHYDPTFLSLFHSFTQNNTPWPVIFDDCLDSRSAAFRAEDEQFKKRWSEYHKEHAVLKCVHSTCNFKRKKN